MSIQIYKPNKNNTGFAFSFYIAENQKTQNPTLFLNAIAQHSWDAKKRIGSFSGSKEDPEKTFPSSLTSLSVELLLVPSAEGLSGAPIMHSKIIKLK